MPDCRSQLRQRQTSEGQILLNVTEHLTCEDWQLIDGTATGTQEISACVISGLHRFGMPRIHEQSCRKVIALLA